MTQPITTIEAAVAVLNEREWQGQTDWRQANADAVSLGPLAMVYDGSEAIAIANSLLLAERCAELAEAVKDLVCQFGYWSDGVGGITTGGLSALEGAFELLGWDDPHPLPEACCDEPGCKKQGDCGTPTPNGYRRTCYDHMPSDHRPSTATDSQSPR